LARDAYLQTILSVLIDDPARPAGVRLAAADLRAILLLGHPDWTATELGGQLRRRATVLQEALARAAGIDGPAVSAAPRSPPSPSGPETWRMPIVIWIPHLRSPFNVGNIIRTAAAFGVAGVVVGEAVPELSHPRLRRAAMGAETMVPVLRGGATDAANLLGEAAAPVVALETGGTPVAQFAFPQRGIMVVGHEELGISEEILEMSRKAGMVVTIPHGGPKSSLNVGVATGIGLSWWGAGIATG
ncbi:MAG: TrmH family RNA methyltransferase, partial [Alkalispirochaeta sp.]